MKGLFVVFHGFSAHSGISKKIFAQCDALRRNGADIELCHIEIAPDGTQRRMVGGQAIRTFGKGLRAKLEKRVSLSDITRYIRHEGVEFLYIRHDHNASPVLIHWLRKVKKLGAVARGAEAQTAHRPHVPLPHGPLHRPHRHLLRRYGDIRPPDDPYLQRHRLREPPAQNPGTRGSPQPTAAGRGEHPFLARPRPRDRRTAGLLRRPFSS